MLKATPSGIGLVVSVFVLGFAGAAHAQLAPPPSSSNSAPNAAMMMNPYYNPYMNPLLNPGAPQHLSAGNALLYMYTAQAARGGIGSGRLSNPAPTKSRNKAAYMPSSASVPGGAASSYFNNSRSGGRAGVTGYYNQRGTRFQNNGN